MKAEKAGQARDSASNTSTASSRAKPGAADIVAAHRCRRSRAGRSRESRRRGNAGLLSQSSAFGATRSAANASAISLDGALVLVEFELAGRWHRRRRPWRPPYVSSSGGQQSRAMTGSRNASLCRSRKGVPEMTEHCRFRPAGGFPRLSRSRWTTRSRATSLRRSTGRCRRACSSPAGLLASTISTAQRILRRRPSAGWLALLARHRGELRWGQTYTRRRFRPELSSTITAGSSCSARAAISPTTASRRVS